MPHLFRTGSLLRSCVAVACAAPPARRGCCASRPGTGGASSSSSSSSSPRGPSFGPPPLPFRPAAALTPLRCIVMKNLPYFCRGEVVRGFGRGSKELGICTANFSEEVVDSFPSDICTGIYYGWGCVGSGDVHKVVLSIGCNPYYKNDKKSVETHIIHNFNEDFYGEILSIIIIGYIRPEQNFDSLDALIAAIKHDVEEAKCQLDLPEHQKFKYDNFFHRENVNSMTNGH